MLKLTILVHHKTLFIAKKIVCCYSIRKNYRKSFQYRILNYFEDSQKSYEESEQNAISTQIRENINEVKSAKRALESIHADIRSSTSRPKSVEDIDVRCFPILDSLRHSEILSLLNAFSKVDTSRLIKTKFYNKSVSVLLEALNNGLLSNHETVQLLFFISLNKDKGAVHVHRLRPRLLHIDYLPLFEKCITAQCFYKTSVKLNPCQSRLLEKAIDESAQELSADPSLLVSICKAVRISGPSTELSLENLSKAIVSLKEPLNFVAIAHVVSLYAEALLLEEEVIDLLVRDSLRIIEEDSSCKLRLKDVDRFLWSVSHLGLTLSPSDKEVLKRYLEQRLGEYKARVNLGIFVNSVLCLHMLQCWSEKVIQDCIEEKTFEPVFYDKQSPFHWKVRSRLQLLVTQIELEMNMLVPKVLKKQIRIEYTPSENVNLVAAVGADLAKRGIINMAVIECRIKTLQIPGVTLITKKGKYHVDVLDNTTCLRNTNTPHGLMKLKSRFLSRSKFQQILVKGNIFENDSAAAQSEIEQQIISNIT